MPLPEVPIIEIKLPSSMLIETWSSAFTSFSPDPYVLHKLSDFSMLISVSPSYFDTSIVACPSYNLITVIITVSRTVTAFKE